jgi:SUMO ligase MMS21 Smc5/6 complex component
MNAEHVAKFFGCTAEQAKAQYAKNAVQLEQNADKAKASKNGKYLRMSESYWRAKAAEFRAKAE